MRITSEVMVTRSLDRLQNRLKAYERTQSQLGTGRRILQPSDDPAGTRRAISLTSAMRAREQELANASDARGWLDSADAQLQTAMTRLARVRELSTAGASEQNADSRRALAAEIREITEEIAGIANERRMDRPLFGGFTGGLAVEKVGGIWQANGTGDEVTRRVSDSELVRVNVTAGEWLGFGSGDGDLLTNLEQLADDVEAGPGGVVSPHLDVLQRASNRIADNLAAIGASTNRVDSAESRARDVLLTLRTELSEVRDVDLAEGMMELQVQQVGYEATLQALAKALPPSLVAFLR